MYYLPGGSNSSLSYVWDTASHPTKTWQILQAEMSNHYHFNFLQTFQESHQTIDLKGILASPNTDLTQWFQSWNQVWIKMISAWTLESLWNRFTQPSSTTHVLSKYMVLSLEKMYWGWQQMGYYLDAVYFKQKTNQRLLTELHNPPQPQS